jgi:hypothetical protein
MSNGICGETYLRPAKHFSDCDRQLLRGIGFQDVTHCADAQGLPRVGRRGFDGEQNDWDRETCFKDLGCCMQAVHHRHAQVGDNQIGPGGLRCVHKRSSIADSSCNFVLFRQDFADGYEKLPVIVREQYAFAIHKDSVSNVRRIQGPANKSRSRVPETACIHRTLRLCIRKVGWI